MPPIQVKAGIHWIGVNDRTTDLFEGLWPITSEGVSYNSYLIRSDKIALVDLAKAAHEGSFFDQLAQLVDPTELDYVVMNHMEPDHTGSLRVLKHLAPKAEFVVSPKAKPMLEAYYGITDRVRVVEDGESISLGAHELEFYQIPFVHWPETMVTYETSQRVLFSCDAFGGYGALRGAIFDDECRDPAFYQAEALRYYVNIVAKYSRPTLMAIDKLGGLDIDVIAPSHGLVWRSDPARIVELYRAWAGYASSAGDPGITVVYGSMYGHTEAMMNAVAEGASSSGLAVSIYDAARTDVSYVLPSLWTKRGVLIGAPTYEGNLFPPAAEVMRMAGTKRIQRRLVGYFGSYGWSGGARKECAAIAEDIKWRWWDALEFQGSASRQALKKGEAFGRRFAAAVAEDADD